MQRFIAGLIQH